MVYGCGNTCIKFVFFFINLLICIFGGIVFAFSLWANLDQDFAVNIKQFVHNVDPGSDFQDLGKYQASLWILVAMGALLLLVGFLGCCGAVCESPILLSLYFFIVFICTICEAFAAILAVSNKEKFKEGMHQVLEKCGNDPMLRQNLKPIEDLLKCCGATKGTRSMFDECKTSQNADCETVINQYMDENGHTLLVAAFVLFAITVLALLFSCVLCRASREVRYAGYYS